MYRPTVLTAALAAAVISFATVTPGAAKDASGSPFARSAKTYSAKNSQPKGTAEKSCASLVECSARAKKEKAQKAAKREPGKQKVSQQKAAEQKTASRKAKKSASRKKSGTQVTSVKTAKAKSRKPVSVSPKVDSIQTASTGSRAKSAPYDAIIARYAAQYGISVLLARAVVGIESNFRPHVTGSAGEVGLMQIKPSTARMLGYTGSVKGLYDPETNIKFGMKYLAMAKDLGDGTLCGTILKYNAGHAARRMNPVSSAYCQKVKVQMASAGNPA